MLLPVSSFLPLRKKRNRRVRLAEWNLIRGKTQRYNAAARVTGTRTGWELLDPPSGFSIGEKGTITARLPHLHTTEPGTLVVRTNQGEIHIPTTIRDAFSTDYRTPRHFFSMARSYNGAAGVDLFDVSVRNLEGTETETLTIASGADGYADASPLDSAPSSSIFYVSRLYNQTNALAHATAVNNAFAIVGYKDASGTMTLVQSPNGMLALRGRWSASGLGFTESTLTMGAAEFQTPGNSNSSFDSIHALACIARRRRSSNARIKLGDQNAYPGFKNVSTRRYRYSTTNRPDDVWLSAAAKLEWFAWSGSRTLTNPTVTNANSGIWGLERENTDINYIHIDENHSGRGNMEFIFDSYDFSEFYVLDIPDSLTLSGFFFVDERSRFVNNAIAKWTGQSHTY